MQNDFVLLTIIDQQLAFVITSGIFIILAAFISIFKIDIPNPFLQKKRLKSLENAMRFNSEIDLRLRTILSEFNASRIWIMQFHNGGHFYPTGKSIQKLSMIYETVADGVDSVQMSFQNVPISLFSYSLKQMLDEDIFIVRNAESEDIRNISSLKNIVLFDSSNSMCCFALKDINNIFVGVLGVSFINKLDFTDKELEELKHYSNAISGFLTTFLKKED